MLPAMPIRHCLHGHRFDSETARLLGIAFEMAMVALQLGDGTVSATRDVGLPPCSATEGGAASSRLLPDAVSISA
jgi:hypothetical protein